MFTNLYNSTIKAVKNFIPTCKYAWLTIKHKYYVFRAGIKTKAPIWNLLVHDWSKFTPSELPHYGRQFFGDKSEPEKFDQAWLHHQNVNKHHPEYWIPRTRHTRSDSDGTRYLIQSYGDGKELWLYDSKKSLRITPYVEDDLSELSNHARLVYLRNELNKVPVPLDMPEKYVREMLADWLGAGRAYNGKYPDLTHSWPWLEENWNKLQLSDGTRATIVKVLRELNYPLDRLGL